VECGTCACVFLGYSLQLSSLSSETSTDPYKGEWTSRVIPMTNDWLCVSLNLSVPATFHVSVNLVTNTSTKTVYSVENIVGETVATDMLTVFEVHVDASQTSYSQLVVYVSEETVVRNVGIENAQCSVTSKFIPQYLQTVSSATILLQNTLIRQFRKALCFTADVFLLYSFRRATSELPRPIAVKLCHMIAIWLRFIMQVQKFGGSSPPQNWGPKACKIWARSERQFRKALFYC